MSGAAGSKYGILDEGVPTIARDRVMQKLKPLIIPSEYKLVIHDASVEKPDNWRDVIIDGGYVAFWDDEKWRSAAGVIPRQVRWWADFPKI